MRYLPALDAQLRRVRPAGTHGVCLGSARRARVASLLIIFVQLFFRLRTVQEQMRWLELSRSFGLALSMSDTNIRLGSSTMSSRGIPSAGLPILKMLLGWTATPISSRVSMTSAVSSTTRSEGLVAVLFAAPRMTTVRDRFSDAMQSETS